MWSLCNTGSGRHQFADGTAPHQSNCTGHWLTDCRRCWQMGDWKQADAEQWQNSSSFGWSRTRVGMLQDNHLRDCNHISFKGQVKIKINLGFLHWRYSRQLRSSADTRILRIPRVKTETFWPTMFSYCVLQNSLFWHPSHSVLLCIQTRIKNSPLQTVPRQVIQILFTSTNSTTTGDSNSVHLYKQYHDRWFKFCSPLQTVPRHVI